MKRADHRVVANFGQDSVEFNVRLLEGCHIAESPVVCFQGLGEHGDIVRRCVFRGAACNAGLKELPRILQRAFAFAGRQIRSGKA